MWQRIEKDRVERRKLTVRTLVGDEIERIEFRPVAVQVRGASKLKPIDEADLAVLRRVASATLPGPVPTTAFPIDQMVHGSPTRSKGFTHVHHLWGDRALLSLSALWTMASAEADPMLRHGSSVLDRAGDVGPFVDEPVEEATGSLAGQPSSERRLLRKFADLRVSPSIQSRGHTGRAGQGKSLVRTWDTCTGASRQRCHLNGIIDPLRSRGRDHRLCLC